MERRTLAATGVIMAVRMQVTTLSVNVANCNFRTDCDVYKVCLVGAFCVYLLERTCICIRHPATTQGMLKLRAHEPIPIPRIFQNQEMDLEHGHIE